jgi:hypothetical protein
MDKLFFSQSMLDTMIDAGKIKLERNVLTVLSGDNPSFELEPAFRFVRTVDNGPDPGGLAGQIKTEREIRDMGAEICMDSIIHRDTAYQADPGFIGEKQKLEGRLTDTELTELLSRFLLDNLL